MDDIILCKTSDWGLEKHISCFTLSCMVK